MHKTGRESVCLLNGKITIEIADGDGGIGKPGGAKYGRLMLKIGATPLLETANRSFHLPPLRAGRTK